MRETLNLAIRLFLITAVAGVLLAVVNSSTAPVIKKQQEETFQKALLVVYPGADEFTDVDQAKLAEIQAAHPNINGVYNAVVGGETKGYVFDVNGRGGYSGDIKFVIGVEGGTNTILGYSVLQSGETPGLGSQIAEEPWISSVVGNTMNEEMVYSDNPTADNDVQAIAGTTTSVKAVLDGLNSVVAALPEISK